MATFDPIFNFEVSFMTWREDIFNMGGELIKKQALLLRASHGMVDYHLIVWNENEQELLDCMILLASQVRSTVEAALEVSGRG